jgi:uncharacterized membrane protein YhaH (DUF805 family)
MFQLFTLLVGIALTCVALVVGLLSDEKTGTNTFAVLICVFSLINIIPALSVTVRRLHDIGKSGWWYLICFVPLIGGLILFVFTVLDSEPDRNEYGPNPKVTGQAGVVI